MEAGPLITSIVLNWNLAEQTAACVASLLASDYAPHRILVVDNGSSDDSVEALQRRFGQRIEVVATGENLYYAGGCNVGLRTAMEHGADWALVLNNDTIVAPDMLSWLVRTATSAPDVGIVSPMIYWADQRSRIWALGGRDRRWLPFPRDVGRNEFDRGQYLQPLAVDYATGCAMLLRREMLQRVGLFDPAYRMYYEDADLSVRARRAGFRLFAEPRAKMWHLISSSARRQAATTVYQKSRYRARFYRQHAARPWRGVTLALVGGQELARAAAAWLG
ncbi:MAG: glycosyltransferase family 2 protein, partial [Chloroflexota bacterium]